MKLISITPEPSTADLFFVFVSFIVPSLCFWVTEVTQLEVCVLLDLPLRLNICDNIYGPTNKAEPPMKIFLCQNEREELRVSTLSRFARAEVIFFLKYLLLFARVLAEYRGIRHSLCPSRGDCQCLGVCVPE